MAGHIKYVRKRKNGIFEYHRRVPTSIIGHAAAYQKAFNSRALFRRSLGTRSQAQAMAEAQSVHTEFERLVHTANVIAGISATLPSAADRHTRPVTTAFLDKLRIAMQNRVTAKWRRLKISAETSATARETLSDMEYERELSASDLRDVLLNHNPPKSVNLPNIVELAEAEIENELLYAPQGSTAFDAVCRAIREGLIAGERETDDMLSDSASSLPSNSMQAAKHAPRLSEVVDAHARVLTKKRSQAELNGAKKAFVSLHGDLRLNEITRRHFLHLCSAEASRQIGGKDSDSVSRPVSAETIKKKISLLRASINRAIQTGQFEGANPAAQIDASMFARPAAPHLMPEKRPLEVQEINSILKHPWFVGCESETLKHRPGQYRLTGMHYWVPLLAIYTGCRAGEIGGLKVSELRLDDQYPHIAITNNEFRSTKGSYTRLIPVFDALLDIGFADVVSAARKRGSTRLFEDWLPPRGNVDPNGTAWSNASLLRSFNRTVIPQSLSDRLQSGARREVTFHSLRGAFKTMLQRKEWALPSNYINEVVGHAKDGLDQRYIKSIPISETYPTMRGCNYKGIIIPPPPT